MTRNTTEFDEFEWSLGPSAGDEELDRVRDHMERIQQRRAELDPDDRTWFTVPENGSNRLFVKVFRHDSFLQRSRYTLFGSQAWWEWKYLLQLHDRNVPVPPPVALGQYSSGGLLSTCFLITHDLGGKTLLEVLREQYGTENWTSMRSHLWVTLADVTASLVEKGFYHRDFHAENLVVHPETTDQESAGQSSIYVTDLHRGTMSSYMTPSEISKMLAFLFYSMQPEIPLWECQRFYRALDAKNLSGTPLPEWPHVLRDLQKRKREHRTSRTSDCFQYYDEGRISFENEQWSVYHNSCVSRDQVCDWLRGTSHESPPPGSTLLKNRSDGRVFRTEDGKAIVKETFGNTLKQKYKRLIGQSKPRKAYQNIHGLKVRDISVPKSLALVEPEHPCTNSSSFLITEAVEGGQLDEYIRSISEQVDGTSPQSSSLFHEFTNYICSLHAEGVFHKDMKANNILLRKTSDGPEFLLIDLDRMTFYDRSLPREPRIKNLVQLNHSLPDKIDRLERYRAWQRYLNWPGVPFDDPEQVLREIIRRTRSRASS